MNTDYDLIVLGAGPAGAAAGAQAVRLGLSTLVIDEQPSGGGQVHRPQAGAILSPDHSPGAALRGALEACGADLAFDRRVWSLAPGFQIDMIGPQGAQQTRGKALILATGAQERVAPITGWTLPGVIGLAAATALIKSQKILPGQAVVIAGRGPLLLLVATLILDGGGKVAAVIDEASPGDWIARTPAMLGRPDLVAQGAGWVAKVLARGVPLYFRARLGAIVGVDEVQAVDVVSIDGSKPRRRVMCDAVCYGHGLTPATEATRQLGAVHDYRAELGGWTPRTDLDQRTSIAQLYACGDGAGVLGAAAAPLRGKLAALAAAADLGALSPNAFQAQARHLRSRLARAARFGAAMTALTTQGLDLIAAAEPDTLICRCEGLDRATLEAAIDAGAASLNGLKAATRCGMGPCGGRFCGEAAAALIASRTGRSLTQVGQMTARPPLRPLPMAVIMGGFRYEDIPFPESAPL